MKKGQQKLRNPIRFKSSVSTAVKVAFELRKLWQLANLMNNCECATFNTCMGSTAEWRGKESRVPGPTAIGSFNF